jgi:hypothetical protein
VQLGSVVAGRLIEAVLDHDVGVLREIDADDDAVSPHAAEDIRFTQWGAHGGEVVHSTCRRNPLQSRRRSGYQWAPTHARAPRQLSDRV